jgi:hypothetical protein
MSYATRSGTNAVYYLDIVQTEIPDIREDHGILPASDAEAAA